DSHGLAVGQPETTDGAHRLARRDLQVLGLARARGRGAVGKDLARARHAEPAHLLAERGEHQLVGDARLGAGPGDEGARPLLPADPALPLTAVEGVANGRSRRSV